MILSDMLKDSNYKLTQFSHEQIQKLEKTLIKKEDKTGYYAIFLVWKKENKVTPEEAARQLYLIKLNDEYNYPYNKMELEYGVSFFKKKKKVIYFSQN